jgi:uncharacterized integral membrane protein
MSLRKQSGWLVIAVLYNCIFTLTFKVLSVINCTKQSLNFFFFFWSDS